MARIQIPDEWLQALEPGTEVSLDECEALVGMKRSADQVQYQFRMLQLKAEVERRLHRCGKMWTIRTIQGRLVVLTHRMASTYNQGSFSSGRRKMSRSNKRLRGVNVASLTAEEIRLHDKALLRQANIMAAVRSQEHVPVMPTVRNTPTMKPK